MKPSGSGRVYFLMRAPQLSENNTSTVSVGGNITSR